MQRPQIDPLRCTGCRSCETVCKSGILKYNEIDKAVVLSESSPCYPGCRICSVVCPQGGITFQDMEEFIARINGRLAGIGCGKSGL